MDNIAVILAGGRGSRMLLNTSKVLAPLCNKPILEYILDSLKNLKFVEKYIVLGQNSSQIQSLLPTDVKTVIQPTPRGTGDAFICACKKFAQFNGRVLLLNGDGPIVSENTLQEILTLNTAKMSIFTGFSHQNDKLGRIIRKNGNVVDVVEAKDCNPSELGIEEKNLGIYCFDNQTLQQYVYSLDCQNAQNEYYVTDLVKIFGKNHKKVLSIAQKREDLYIPSVNTLSELSACQQIMQGYINDKWIDAGVNIIHKNNTYIDSNSKIGIFTTIYPNCVIIDSKIGKNCVIHPNCVIKNAFLRDDCVIGSNSVIENAEINNNLTPLSYIKF